MHSYETGRLNLPFTGICTFAKKPYVEDWSTLEADAAILGAPFDAGTQFRAGARFGPRAVREASTLFSFGHAGAYDHEDDVTYLGPEVRIVDMGDADIVHTDTLKSHANIRTGVEAALAAGALPVVIGGDHSVNIPCVEAYEGQKPFHILQIDAHLDFVDERHGVTRGHGNPMRRAAEKPWVSGLTQVGIRNVSSTARDGYEAARAMGSDILSVRHGPRPSGPRRRRGAHPRGRPGLHHARHRRFLPLHRARHGHAQPRRVPLLRGAGTAAIGGARAPCRGHRPGRGRTGPRPHRIDGNPCGTGAYEPSRVHLPRPRHGRLTQAGPRSSAKEGAWHNCRLRRPSGIVQPVRDITSRSKALPCRHPSPTSRCWTSRGGSPGPTRAACWPISAPR
ncbi:Agmatinase [Salipiger mucosus DSM 16094]|uniref:Agmatinase n=1 Tax=Salipiger mucosus DSM 16094 TaxID=1123237 RepID=S9QKK0_9RHOB|nr:Agmatinase [Salipiger mucosus DSM 16094]